MRTIPIPAVVLYTLTPLLALAQSTGMEPTENQVVLHSSQFWFWVISVAIAVVAFVVSNYVFARRVGPHFRRRAS